jgi:hypothetical protein
VLRQHRPSKTVAGERGKTNAPPFPTELGRCDDDSLTERTAFSPLTDFELAGNNQLSGGADMLRLRVPFDDWDR